MVLQFRSHALATVAIKGKIIDYQCVAFCAIFCLPSGSLPTTSTRGPLQYPALP